jgi:hypothetical protein
LPELPSEKQSHPKTEYSSAMQMEKGQDRFLWSFIVILKPIFFQALGALIV